MRCASLILGGLGLLLCWVGQAKADLLWTLNDSSNGVSGSVDFIKVTGGFEIKVINTETNTPDAGHAISQIQFTVGSNLGLPTAFTELAGTETIFTGSPTSVDYKPPTSAQHWPFSVSGSTVSLLDVGGAIGGQPNHLIVASGSTPNASLANTHLPSFIGETDFFFADSTVPADFTTSDITTVQLAFGTQPEVPLEKLSPQVGGTAPDPPSVVLFGTTALGAAALMRRKTRARS